MSFGLFGLCKRLPSPPERDIKLVRRALKKHRKQLLDVSSQLRQAIVNTEQLRSMLEGLRGEQDDQNAKLIALSEIVQREAQLSWSKPLTTKGSQETFLELARCFSPRSAIGYSKIRLGGDHDGGYVVLDDLSPVKGAFSIGVGDDNSWDTDIASRGIPVYQLDHTIAFPPATHPKIRFLPLRLVPYAHREGVTLSELVERFLTDADSAYLLKMDIEGDEWTVLEACDLEVLQRFSQIVCEFHYFSRAASRSWCRRATAVMQKLSLGFQVVHVHGNNFAPFVCIGNVPFPEVLEVTFANRRCYTFAENNECFPSRLDQRNWPETEDLFLGQFQF